MNNEHLTLLIHRWLAERKLKASTAKKWQWHEGRGDAHSYWWNYFLVEGIWWGFNVYDDETVQRVI